MSLPRFICAADLSDDLLGELADVGTVELSDGTLWRPWRSDLRGVAWLQRVGGIRAGADDESDVYSEGFIPASDDPDDDPIECTFIYGGDDA